MATEQEPSEAPNIIDLFKNQTEQQQVAFEKFAKQTLKIGVHGMLEEYQNEFKSYLHKSGALLRETCDQHPSKNRYKDVTCCDATRVVINDGKNPDYIHANHIRGDPLQTPYIATQGPTPHTVVDFWRMIYGSRVKQIVMLCDLVELGRTKCERYYPQSRGEEFIVGDIKVVCTGSTSLDVHIQRTILKMSHSNGNNREIKHYHFKTWPDKSIPKSTRAVLRLLTYVRSSNGPPVVVHCSAGIGRTGTLVGIEMCLQQILQKGTLNILEMAKKLRDQRAHSIQVELQYISLAVVVMDYGVALKCITNKELIEEINKFKNLYEDMAAATQPTQEVAPVQAAPVVRRGGTVGARTSTYTITYQKGKKPTVRQGPTVRQKRTKMVKTNTTTSAEK